MNVLDRRHTIAPPGYNRWLVPPAALAVHLSIGQVYAFSVLKNPLLSRFESSYTSIAVIFSIAIVMLGLSAAFGGKWMERNGPRKAMALSATFWVSGFLVAALGVQLDQLWIVYLGYGFLGGIGLGIGYISPVSTLIKWFPDRPGLATGLAIMGFGGGAMLASPLTAWLLDAYAVAPAESATADQWASAIVPTLLTLAAIYGVLMAAGAAVIRVPAPGWKPAGWVPKPKSDLQTHADVRVSSAVRTKQFYLLWIVLFTNVTAGIGILEQASPMIQDFFPGAVTAATAAGFVGLLSLANMSGRFVWSSTSDVVGRKRMYMIYLGVGALLYGLVAAFGSSSVALFVVLTFFIVTFYGGGFATIPAYLKDLFGQLEVGAIHGRLLTAWSAAGVAGPLIVNRFADSLSARGVEGAALYLPSIITMCGVLVVGFVANLLVTKVDEKYHEPATAPAAAPAVSTAAQPVAVGAGTLVSPSALAEHDLREKADVVVEDETPEEIAEELAAAPLAHAGSGIRVAALTLWTVVGLLLAYGVLQTAIKAAALFA